MNNPRNAVETLHHEMTRLQTSGFGVAYLHRTWKQLRRDRDQAARLLAKERQRARVEFAHARGMTLLEAWGHNWTDLGDHVEGYKIRYRRGPPILLIHTRKPWTQCVEHGQKYEKSVSQPLDWSWYGSDFKAVLFTPLCYKDALDIRALWRADLADLI